MKNLFSIASLIMILFGSTTLHAQKLSGQVLESDSKKSVSYVNIGIVGKDIGTVSDKSGKFNLNISNATNSDTLRFSYIGFESYDIGVRSIRNYGFNNPVFIKEKLFELDEIIIESKKLIPKTLGVRKKDGYPIPLFKKAKTEIPFPQKNYRHEVGTLFRDVGLVYLDSVQVNFSEFAIDTVDLRINIYSFIDGDFENVLKEPVYIQIVTSKSNTSPVIDLSKLGLFLDQNFLITIENYKRIPNNSVKIFANLKSKGYKFPTYYRSNSQSDWINLKSKSRDFGISIQAFLRQNQNNPK